SGADPELVALCKRCLSADPSDRPTNAGAVAEEVAAYQAAAADRVRHAELDLVRAKGERAKAEAEAKQIRQQKRLQLALAVAILLIVGLGAGGWIWASNQKAQRREQTAQKVNEALDEAA